MPTTFKKVTVVGIFTLAVVSLFALNHFKEPKLTFENNQTPSKAVVTKKYNPDIEEQNQVINELESEVSAVLKLQKTREIQIQAYQQQASKPLVVPELPNIPELVAPVAVVNRAIERAKLDPDSGNTLPQEVMEGFARETGLTQQEIEEAMNK